MEGAVIKSKFQVFPVPNYREFRIPGSSEAKPLALAFRNFILYALSTVPQFGVIGYRHLLSLL